MRIVCWNVKTGAPAQALRERLDRLDAEVVLLQELDLWSPRVAGRNTAQALFGDAPGSGWAWTFAPSLQSQTAPAAPLQADGGRPALYGNLVAVRGRIEASLSVALGPLTADPVLHDRAPARERRTAIVARVACGPWRLVVACAHLAHGDAADALRRHQAADLMATAAAFAGAGEDIVIGADLNATAADIARWPLASRWRVHSPAPAGEGGAGRVGVDHFIVDSPRRVQVSLQDGEGLSDHDPVVLTLA